MRKVIFLVLIGAIVLLPGKHVSAAEKAETDNEAQAVDSESKLQKNKQTNETGEKSRENEKPSDTKAPPTKPAARTDWKDRARASRLNMLEQQFVYDKTRHEESVTEIEKILDSAVSEGATNTVTMLERFLAKENKRWEKRLRDVERKKEQIRKLFQPNSKSAKNRGAGDRTKRQRDREEQREKRQRDRSHKNKD